MLKRTLLGHVKSTDGFRANIHLRAGELEYVEGDRSARVFADEDIHGLVQFELPPYARWKSGDRELTMTEADRLRIRERIADALRHLKLPCRDDSIDAQS